MIEMTWSALLMWGFVVPVAAVVWIACLIVIGLLISGLRRDDDDGESGKPA